MRLTLRNARTEIENALLDRLATRYAKRLATLTDADALRALSSRALHESAAQLVYVTAAGYAYRWRPWSLDDDNDDTVIKPDDRLDSQPGRWRKTDSTSSTGYLRTVELYNDDGENQDTIDQRIYGGRPAMLVAFVDEHPTPKSVIRGALYYSTMNFLVLVASTCARPGQGARQGSGAASEFEEDPGTAAMIGDVKAALAGSDLGIEDVAYVEFGRSAPVVQDLAERRFLESIDIEVRFTQTAVDDTEEGEELERLDVHYRPTQMDQAGRFDDENFVATHGLTVAAGVLVADGVIAAGTAVVGGEELEVDQTPHAFAANKVTYRDLLPSGEWDFVEVAIGETPRAPKSGALRVGATLTDATEIVSDFLIGAWEYERDVDQVEPPALTAISISPTSPTLAPEATQQFTAVGTYADATTRTITELVEWSSDDEDVAVVEPIGLATAVGAGTAHVVAKLDDITSNTATLTVA